MMMRKAWAFIKKDFCEEVHYPTVFFNKFGGVVFLVVEAYILRRLFSQEASVYLAHYGGDYFPFAVVGWAFALFFLNCANIFPEAVWTAQSKGTLEILLTTPLTPYSLIILSSLWSFLSALFQLLLFFVVGVLFLRCNLVWTHLFAAFIVGLIAVVCFCGFGMMSAASCLVLKRHINVRGFLYTLVAFFGGVYFPIAIFPECLQKISHLVPLTYFLNLMREVLINGVSLANIYYQVILLAVFSLVVLLIGLFLLRISLSRLRRDGSAAFY